MTTNTRILTHPIDIPCPDNVIDGWLQEWNKFNIQPIGLDDLDDVTYDFVYRAVDYGSNQELRNVLEALLEIHPDGREIASNLLNKRRPMESTPGEEVLNEIKIFKAFVMAEMTRLEDKLKSITNVSE
jgi:hypothetical protein